MRCMQQHLQSCTAFTSSCMHISETILHHTLPQTARLLLLLGFFFQTVTTNVNDPSKSFRWAHAVCTQLTAGVTLKLREVARSVAVCVHSMQAVEPSKRVEPTFARSGRMRAYLLLQKLRLTGSFWTLAHRAEVDEARSHRLACTASPDYSRPADEGNNRSIICILIGAFV